MTAARSGKFAGVETDPVLAAAAASFYAAPPEAIAAAYVLNRIELGLLGVAGRARGPRR